MSDQTPYPGSSPLPQPSAPPAPPVYGAPPAPPAFGTPFAAPLPPQAPPGAYGVPVGGYSAPMGAYAVPPSTPPAPRTLGALALVASLIALLVIPVVGAILAFQIGEGVPVEALFTLDGDVNWAALAPVRTLVLWSEILFWVGTAIGVLAIVLGVIAAVRKRGRGLGIAGAIIAVFGPVAFFGLGSVLWGVGTAAGLNAQYS